MKIVFLGPKATFNHYTVVKAFPNEEIQPMKTIPECLDAVMNDEADAAVVPLENALEGSVTITLDYLVHEVKLPIQGEINTPIQQHFMVHPQNEDQWKAVTNVYSHSHAIAQCHKFLHKELRGVPSENFTSTAAAAEYVMQNPELKIAAIASELAAYEYGLSIVKPNIHDYDHNTTRFIVVSKKEVEFTHTNAIENGPKTTLMIELPENHPGSLHQVLSAFSWRNLNMSKIESRPKKTGLGNYFFLIDIEMAMDEVLIPGAIQELEALGCSVSILGSYRSFSIQGLQTCDTLS
ncbi:MULTISPECIES: prephenate dehydratase [Bacillus]|uniref:prephenate dehydratase n=1 Tax=Bacillus TaxID=1386 RepID=UPI0002EEA97E|nr:MULTISPECIES: prephenate dehydratase [Bacillus]